MEPTMAEAASHVPMASTARRGFFQEYLSRLRTSLSPDQWSSFSDLKNAHERLSFVGRLPGSADPQWPVDLSTGKKDAAEAKSFKERGNQAFLKGDFNAALQLYTKCVLLTPFGEDLGTAEIAVATANRSAALYRLGKFRKALEDIESALSMDFPKGLRHKVLDRKARCLLALSDRRKYNQDASRKSSRETSCGDNPRRGVFFSRARDAAMATLRDTLTALDEATDLDAERRAKRETDVRMMLCVLTKAAEDSANAVRGPKGSRQQLKQSTAVPVNELEEDDEETGCCGHSNSIPALAEGRHPLYSGASKKLSFARRGAAGRQAEAKVPVAAGDVLVTEKPCAAVLLQEKTATHCYECFKPLLAPVPCPSCSAVSFCSSSCRYSAMSTHHATECSTLALLWASGMSLTCHIALRLISQRNVQFFRDLRPHIEAARQAVAISEGKTFPGEGGSPAEEEVFWSNELGASQRDYLSVLRLVTHESERSPEDNFQRAAMAIFLIKCLREWTEFFEEEPQLEGDSTNGETQNEDDLLVGGLLVHHLQMAQFNAHEVFELEIGGEDVLCSREGSDMISDEVDIGTWRSVGIGGALYPSLALFNHSCDPGVVRYFIGNTVVVKAIRAAKPGEMVGENYGPIYTRYPREHRQTQLRKQYWFDCSCLPCTENWPLFENMQATSSGSMRFRCPKTVATKSANNKDGKPCSRGFVIVHTDSMAPVMNCKECGASVNVIKGLKILAETDETFVEAEERLKELMSTERPTDVGSKQWKTKVEGTLSEFLNILRSIENVLDPPLRDITLCQHSARRCMLAMGNVRKTPRVKVTEANGVVP